MEQPISILYALAKRAVPKVRGLLDGAAGSLKLSINPRTRNKRDDRVLKVRHGVVAKTRPMLRDAKPTYPNCVEKNRARVRAPGWRKWVTIYRSGSLQRTAAFHPIAA